MDFVLTAVTRWLLGKDLIDQAQADSIQSIAATCGLIHDIGNPPFGHAGEIAIQDWVRAKVNDSKHFPGLDMQHKDWPITQLNQDFLRFEGNAQTLRILSKLQLLVDQYGLNLTIGTLSAACKYVAPSHQTNGGLKDLK